MIPEAIILAGGRGTRLQGIFDDIPKPMAPIKGRPFLGYLLRFIKNQGIKKVILSVGYKHQAIKDYFKSDFNGLTIVYSVEDEPLGTGGAVINAMELVSGDNILILNGDSFLEINLSDFYRFSKQKDVAVSVALAKVDNTDRYGSVEFDSTNRITRFSEKNSAAIPGYINAGIYVLRKSFFVSTGLNGSFSLEKDFIEHYYRVIAMYGYSCDGFFIDIGLPEDYLRAQDEFERFKY
jgi:D-glycero-alpha-D-manno-heptose 1-phosphate guanylyltransferase